MIALLVAAWLWLASRSLAGVDSYTAEQVREYVRAAAALRAATRKQRESGRPDGRDWRGWVERVFYRYVRPPFARYHVAFWDHIAAIRLGESVRAYVTIWPRRGAKSTSLECATAYLGATHERRFALYVCGTQDQANDHVQNIAAILETDEFARWYPATARRALNKYRVAKAWRKNRLRTSDGFTVQAIGLDTAARGIKIEGDRPDLLIFDDIDSLHDTPDATKKKIETITKSILPAASDNPAIIFAQNLILENGVIGQLASGEADFLADRVLSGPHKAIEDFEYETDPTTGTTVITGGTPTWDARTLDDYQREIDRIGITAFLAEFQHEVQNLSAGMFAKIEFLHCDPHEVPPLRNVVVAVDPAVSDSDNSDAFGVQADGIADSGRIYRLRSWEDRTSPNDAITRAIRWARELGATEVVIETNQGGTTWDDVYELAWRKLIDAGDIGRYEKRLSLRHVIAGGRESKMWRASQLVATYERGTLVHVRGTHAKLEKALRRFGIEKPYDLVDAGYWSVWALLNPPKRKGGSVDYTNVPDPDEPAPRWWQRRGEHDA